MTVKSQIQILSSTIWITSIKAVPIPYSFLTPHTLFVEFYIEEIWICYLKESNSYEHTKNVACLYYLNRRHDQLKYWSSILHFQKVPLYEVNMKSHVKRCILVILIQVIMISNNTTLDCKHIDHNKCSKENLFILYKISCPRGQTIFSNPRNIRSETLQGIAQLKNGTKLI